MSIALVAHTGAASSTSETVITSPIDTTGASLLAAYAVAAGGTFSDSAGNIWSQLTAETSSEGGFTATLYYCVNPITSASHTVTVVGLGYPVVCFAAFSGTFASLVDQQNGAVDNGSAVITLQPGSITPSINGELVLVGLGCGGGPATYSIDSGFAITDQFPWLAGTHYGAALAFQVQAVAAPVNPTWTATTGIDGPASSIGSFNSAPILNAEVSQSALDIVTLETPYVRLFQSALDIVTIPFPLTLGCNNPPVGLTLNLYGHNFVAAGGVLPYTWAITAGSLPPGVTLDGATGIVAGISTASGLFGFTLQVTDTLLNVGVGNCSITVAVSLVNLEVIVRGMKRIKARAPEPVAPCAEPSHVKRAV